jgi:hypothetical protein
MRGEGQRRKEKKNRKKRGFERKKEQNGSLETKNPTGIYLDMKNLKQRQGKGDGGVGCQDEQSIQTLCSFVGRAHACKRRPTRSV